jgi:hypothetical protein
MSVVHYIECFGPLLLNLQTNVTVFYYVCGTTLQSAYVEFLYGMCIDVRGPTEERQKTSKWQP